jgi:tRNA (cmo5U34)-methyltransferase
VDDGPKGSETHPADHARSAGHDHSVADNRWRSAEHAADWLARHDRPQADQLDRYRLVARLFPFERDAALAFADVGAGNGTLAEVLLDAYPRSRAVCLDVNPTMIAAGQERLARFGDRARYVEADLEATSWPAEAAGPFDAVVSSRAIHHLPDEQKRAVFGWIFERLRPGGWLVNYDYIRAPNPALSELYQRVAADGQHGSGGPPADHHQGHHSHTSPLLGQLALLEAVGFVDVDCFWKHLASALYGGRLP